MWYIRQYINIILKIKLTYLFCGMTYRIDSDYRDEKANTDHCNQWPHFVAQNPYATTGPLLYSSVCSIEKFQQKNLYTQLLN